MVGHGHAGPARHRSDKAPLLQLSQLQHRLHPTHRNTAIRHTSWG